MAQPLKIYILQRLPVAWGNQLYLDWTGHLATQEMDKVLFLFLFNILAIFFLTFRETSGVKLRASK